MTPVVPWRMFTLSPLLPLPPKRNRRSESDDDTGGWILLGEVDKIVGVSAVRFQSIGVHWLNAGAVGGGSCVAFEVSLVAADEVITVAAVSPRGIYLTQDIRQQHGSICEQETVGNARAKKDDLVLS